MATFKICVFKHHRRKDNKFPVFIRVCWKRKYAYIKTEYYVVKSQIRTRGATFELQDAYIINELNIRIAKYETLKVTKLKSNIEQYTAGELAEYFKKESLPGTDTSIDFIEFSLGYCETVKHSTAKTLRRSVNAMIDYCNGRNKIAISEISARFLEGFDRYLRTTRTLRRKDQRGNIVTTTRNGLSDAGVWDYMTAVKTLFNAAIREYNDEDRGEIRIAHYPFRTYKPRKVPETAKKVLTIEQIRSIYEINAAKLSTKRSALARDVFMLSFLLAGINLADIYALKAKDYKAGRISYCRQKTKDKRQDRAFISVKVFPEAEQYIKWYRDPRGESLFCFASLYSSFDIFQANINKGLKVVAAAAEINEDLTSYYARFSFATIARNNCDVSRDDIDLALVHANQSLKMTDRYIKKDWSRVDEVIRKVIDCLTSEVLPGPEHIPLAGQEPVS